MLEYKVHARRVDANGSFATCKEAELVIDTGLAGRPDAFNPAELFLASIAACMLKGIERVSPMLKFELRGVEVSLEAKRRDLPPRILSVDYILTPERHDKGADQAITLQGGPKRQSRCATGGEEVRIFPGEPSPRQPGQCRGFCVRLVSCIDRPAASAGPILAATRSGKDQNAAPHGGEKCGRGGGGRTV